MFWLVVGPPDNFKIGLERGGLWGLPFRYEAAWARIHPGDTVVLYATRPVKGAIAYGQVSGKRRTEELFWPDEIQEGRLLWPLLITFDVKRRIPYEKWPALSIKIRSGQITLQRAIQRLGEETASELIQSLDEVNGAA